VVSARVDVEQQKDLDRAHGARQAQLYARMAAVITAQRALARGEYSASYPLRAALVDLAAVSELLAEELRGKIYRPERLSSIRAWMG
jgi:hypothetical protein